MTSLYSNPLINYCIIYIYTLKHLCCRILAGVYIYQCKQACEGDRSISFIDQNARASLVYSQTAIFVLAKDLI